MQPKIDLIIPVFNGRDYLREAVTSVLAENQPGLQVTVVDDGSTDEGLRTIEDLPVQTVRQPQNRGLPQSLNLGLAETDGEYVTFLDSDDRLAAGGIKWRLEWLSEHPLERLVGGLPAGIVDHQGQPLPQFRHLLHPLYEVPQRLNFEFFRQGGNFPCGLCFYLYRRSLWKELGPLNGKYTSAWDLDFLLRILQITEVPILTQPVFFRRMHGTNHSLVKPAGNYKLHPRTIAECTTVLADYGLRAKNWDLWEASYGLG